MRREQMVMVMAGMVVGWLAPSAWADTGKAVIRGTAEESSVRGAATLADTAGGLQVTVQVSGVLQGTHGLHIHQYGECGDAGNAAGGHFNPDKVPHGFLPSDGLTKAHPGDMGNIEVGPDGTGSVTVVLPGVTLSGGTYSVAGRAIVLHEKTDDFGQPTGNAGARIGCGAIVLAK